MFKKFSGLLLIALIVVFASAAHAKVVWKLAHNRMEDSPSHQAAAKFAARVAELTNGEMEIKLFPNGQLGDWSVICERTSLGVIEMSFVSQNSQSDKRVSIFYFPGIFADVEHYKRNMLPGAPYREEVDKLLLAQNLKALVQFPGTFGAASFKEKPKDWDNITAPKDMKVRAANDPTLIATAELMGFLATPMPISETYTALQTGVVDGVFGPGAEGHYNWYRDVVKYYAPINSNLETYTLAVNTNVWAKLDPKLQEKVLQAAKEMELERYETFNATEKEWLQKIADSGVEILPFPQEKVEEFIKVAKEKSWPALAEKIDPEYIPFILSKLKP